MSKIEKKIVSSRANYGLLILTVKNNKLTLIN